MDVYQKLHSMFLRLKMWYVTSQTKLRLDKIVYVARYGESDAL